MGFSLFEIPYNPLQDRNSHIWGTFPKQLVKPLLPGHTLALLYQNL